MRFLPKTETAGSLVVTIVVAAVAAVVVPLQSYLGNMALYPYSFGRLLPELALLFAGFAVALTLVRRILPNGLRVMFSALLTALTVCAYLETGLLSLGIPELNGGSVAALASPGRAVLDAGVWAAVILAFVAFARRLAAVLHWISLAVLVLFAASLADVRRPASDPAAGATGDLSSGFASQPTVVANVTYSPARNVLVFVLDSMPGRDAAEVLRANPDLAARFPGFVAFPQNLGMHDCTKRGVPGLVTGRHYDPQEMSEAEYPMTMYGTNSVVTAAVAAGWGVAFSPDLLPYGYTNLKVTRHVARQEARRTRDALAILRQSREVPYLSLFDLVGFRLAPFGFKGPILYSRIRHAVKGRHSDGGFWGEAMQYAELAARPTAEDPRPFFGFFHTWGVHPPLVDGLKAAIRTKLEKLGDLFETYRANGLYSRSLIIVTSDHGLDQATPVDGAPPSASAILWVKAEGPEKPFAFSDAPTSHARIAPLIARALSGPIDAQAVEAELTKGPRVYRAEVRTAAGAEFRDWKLGE